MRTGSFAANLAKRLAAGLLVLFVAMSLPLPSRAAELDIPQKNCVTHNSSCLLAYGLALPDETEPPTETKPQLTEPPATEPPAASEPQVTEPPATEPPATEPPATTEPPEETVPSIDDLTPEQISELISNMTPEEITELMKDLTPEQRTALMENMTQEELDLLFGKVAEPLLKETGDSIANSFVQLIDDYINGFTENIVTLIRGALFLEELDLGTDIFSTTNINNALNLMYSVMVLLLFLKFAWKGVKVYTLWRDGDADVSPAQMYTNAIAAVVTALAFPTIYKAIGRFILAFGTRLIEEFPAFSSDTTPSGLKALGAVGLIYAFYFIIEIILSIVIMSQGIELFVLRMGVPIAVAGMVDSDGGVWKPYTAALVKTFASILVRIVLLGLSFRVIVASSFLSTVLAIALCLTAFKMPRILGHIIMPGTQGAGGTARTVMMAMRMFRRR